MSNLETLVFNINLSILFSVIGYKAIIFLKDESIQKFSKKNLLLTTRIFFIGSIFLPIIIFNLNIKKEVPFINDLEFHVFSENIISSKERTKNLQAKKILKQRPITTKPQFLNFKTILFFMYLLGLIFALYRLIKQIFSLHLIIKKSVLHKKVKFYRLYYSHLTKTPFTFLSLFGPVVIFPTNIISDELTVSISLQHENQHIRQKDIH